MAGAAIAQPRIFVEAIICPVALTAAQLRERLRQILVGTVVFFAAAAILTYGVDFGLFRLRVVMNRNPYGSVVVNHYYAVLQKNGKTQLIFDPPAPATCVNTLLPHSGMQPCWYLRRHTDQRTDI
jgi:hypothetical protein